MCEQKDCKIMFMVSHWGHTNVMNIVNTEKFWHFENDGIT